MAEIIAPTAVSRPERNITEIRDHAPVLQQTASLVVTGSARRTSTLSVVGDWRECVERA
ncbi:hypothetical protein [Bradyrhizobium sp.]|uniref:Uncharacterized protein n=1 Tax=Bradyrhizobium denitrificans TaxID=2734912 RepID=A0ABS5GAS4_9BRAD|nr:hypothetical protein [Bradyrhizobium sp.]MBR1138265.1 hypothetical protein [Bradyrhizobium denitrificans]MDU1668236.1 hypothetical protein [Bradyrhizobium sp.]MDU1695461.1 hypothetical protein [Bradyrhizobium sp.]MDU3047457.1 hypothetical protein [Bradyrhizobium sp.]MDU6140786.1 hypothetical protein [Bradyrhizobium sp.]